MRYVSLLFPNVGIINRTNASRAERHILYALKVERLMVPCCCSKQWTAASICYFDQMIESSTLLSQYYILFTYLTMTVVSGNTIFKSHS